jgi:hypothetical protein
MERIGRIHADTERERGHAAGFDRVLPFERQTADATGENHGPEN